MDSKRGEVEELEFRIGVDYISVDITCVRSVRDPDSLKNFESDNIPRLTLFQLHSGTMVRPIEQNQLNIMC